MRQFTGADHKRVSMGVLAAGAALGVLMLAATPAAAQDMLRIGSSTGGELSARDDRLDTGEYLDTYLIEGRAGDRLSVRMSSGEVDPYLMIRGPGGFAEDNDDAASGDLNALLDVRLPADGTYRIVATSYAPGEQGRYSLEVSDRAGGYTPDYAAAGADLVPGASVNGALQSGDETLTSGEYADTWMIPVRAGQRYVATLRSADFDSYLLVRGAGLQEDNDDDPTGRGSLHSRLEFTAPVDGEVQLVATTYQPGERGGYVLSLDGPGASSAAPPWEGPAAEPAEQTALAIGDRVNGRLGAGDRQLRSGEYLNSYSLRGRRGDRVDLTLTSREFDPYLMISGPAGFSAENDDDAASGATDSRLSVTLPEDGVYEVVATSYAAGETGAYVLSALVGAGEAPTPVSHGGDLMEIGDRSRGALRAGDDTLDSGEFVDSYRFTGRRGERVAVELTSSEFDTYLMLVQPDGEQIDNDDATDTTDSRIDTVLPADGEYGLRVTSYAPGEVGDYALSIAPSLGTPRQAGVEGGPRVFAVMVGVSDYEGDHNDLPYTDEDAEKLAETLARQGVLNPSSVVLTNGGATRASVMAAFDRVAAEAGPEDMFLFFFSGHGVQNDAAPSALEPDGREETIVLYDGEISDAELGEMFGRLDTRLSLLVVDSCFSGGFARNVVNRPGVMGVFSSEEDLTSAVADKFEAGGYLAHFVRAGLSGDANIDGDDLVTAGELSIYLRRQFTAEVEAEGVTAETTDGQRGYQHLVVDRGGVQVDDVIVRLGDGGGERVLGGR